MHDAAVAVVEQLLVLSAQELAGAKQRGRDAGSVLWHGAQRGVVSLAERQLHVQRPRLRDKRGGEVHVPAYDRLRDDAGMGQRVRDIMVAGVSTRRYASVLTQAAGTVGVSKSAVSRRFVEASAAQLGALNERSLKDVKVLVIYIDGIVVAGHHIIAAVGVDEAGDKHLLGLAPGASENAQVVKDLLQGLIDRGLDASWHYLFVIDGGKALRSAIDEMFGQRAHVQRCRTHKLRNVLDRLPKTEAAQTKAVMMAAYKLAPKERGGAGNLNTAISGTLCDTNPG
jgi:transposase-like protein